MPVDMQIPNSIINAFATGSAERQRQEQISHAKAQDIEERKIKKQQLEEQKRQFDANLDLLKALRKVQTLETGMKAAEDIARTGIYPPGSEVLSMSMGGKFSPDIGISPTIESLKLDIPGLEGPLTVPSPGAYARQQGELEREKFAPRAESAREIADIKAETAKTIQELNTSIRQQLQDANLKMQERLTQMRGEDAYRRSIDTQLLRNQGKDDPYEKLLTPDEAERFSVPFGTTRKDVFGKTPGVKLTPSQTAKLSAIDELEKLALQSKEILDKTNYGMFQGPAAGTIVEGKRAIGLVKRNPLEETVRAKLANIEATVAKERAGTSFTTNEQGLLERYVIKPSAREDPTSAKAKLEEFINHVRSMRADLLENSINRTKQKETSNSTGIKVDLDSEIEKAIKGSNGGKK